MKFTGVELNVRIGLKAERKTLVALEAETIVFRRGGKHAARVHVVATGTRGDVAFGVGALGELFDGTFMASTAEFGKVFVAESRGGFAAEGHPALFVHVVAVRAGGRIARKVGRGQKSLDGVAAGAVGLSVTFRAGFVAHREGRAARIVDEEAQPPAFTHVGEAGAVAGFAGDGLVGAAEELAMIASAPAVVTGQTGCGSHFTRPQRRLLAAVYPHGKQGHDEEADDFQARPEGTGKRRGFLVKTG